MTQRGWRVRSSAAAGLARAIRSGDAAAVDRWQRTLIALERADHERRPNRPS